MKTVVNWFTLNLISVLVYRLIDLIVNDNSYGLVEARDFL